MKHPRNRTHSPSCTAVLAHEAGQLQSPWSAAFRVEDELGAAGVYRWCVAPCADPRCPAERRMLSERPAALVHRAHAAA